MLIAFRKCPDQIYFDLMSLLFFPNCWLCIFKHHFVQVQMAILRKYFWSKQTCWHFYKGTPGLKGERKQTTTSSVRRNVKPDCHYALMIFLTVCVFAPGNDIFCYPPRKGWKESLPHYLFLVIHSTCVCFSTMLYPLFCPHDFYTCLRINESIEVSCCVH